MLVDVGDVLLVQAKVPDALFRGTPMFFQVAQVAPRNLCLINLATGNRWENAALCCDGGLELSDQFGKNFDNELKVSIIKAARFNRFVNKRLEKYIRYENEREINARRTLAASAD